MGIKNYLIEGVSGTGKTSVCHELRRRGYHALNGDRDLAYKGDPKTGKPVEKPGHEYHIWNVEKVRELVADQRHAASFFCGGSRNFHHFIDWFDLVFVLEVDVDTLRKRLSGRTEDEFGGKPEELEMVLRLHATKEDLPKDGVIIDAAAPLAHVVDKILEKCT